MNIKHLNAEQFDNARLVALERVQARNGNEPTLAQFKNAKPIERGLLILYALATLIFVVAFLVSSQHVIAYANVTAGKAHIPVANGGLTAIVHVTWYFVHELGLLLLAETSMIVFMVMARVTSNRLQRVVMYGLAVASALFVVWANLQSGLVWYLSILIPSITIGVSMVYEHWFVQSILEERQARTAFQNALTQYRLAQSEPSQHTDYPSFLRQAVFTALLETQMGTGVREKKAWLTGLSIPERAYLSDIEIGLNDWNVTAIPTHEPITPITEHHEVETFPKVETFPNGNGHNHG